MKLNNFTSTAIKAALAGGKVLSKYFDKNINVTYKGRIDPVTKADKESQKEVFNVIQRKFPKHSFLGEEEGANSVISDDYCWITDPLDGTVNFIHNLPIFCVSVALKYKDEIVTGVIHAPILKETFVAQKGEGAFLNGKKIKVSDTDSLVRSLAVTGFPYDMSVGKNRVFNNFVSLVNNVQGIRRLGSAALDLAYVAMGRFEAFWEEGLFPWDIAAGALILEEAGGKVTDFKGENKYTENKNILATNGFVHNKVLKLLSSAK
ncbi:inositol monophosphatase family protein [Elusimicrobiota bacterium]